MKILVFGASGKVGRLVVDEALARGHTVVAFVHKHAPAERPGLTAIQGDVHDTDSVQRALQGCDAVASCLASWGTPNKDVLSSAMQAVIPAMQIAGVRRIVTITGNIALLPGEQVNFFIKATHGFLTLIAPKVAKDAEDHLRFLAESQLTWTSVRSPVMTPWGAAGYRLVSGASVFGAIPRRAVATSVIDLLETADHASDAPVIHKA